MPWFGWVIICVIVLMFVYAFCVQREEVTVSPAVAAIERSNGTFDKHAQEAVEAINAKPEPTAEEHIVRADTIRYNLANDTITTREMADAVADDYAIALALALDDDETELADLAVDRLRTIDDAILRTVVPPDVTYTAAADVAGDMANAARKNAAKAAAKTRAGVARHYLRMSSQVASDRQNVHDSKVNSDLRDTLARLGPGRNPRQCIAEARELCADNPRALSALSLVEAGNYIMSLGTSEDRVFASVWSRADHPDNSLVRDDLRRAAVNALADCIEGSGPVCINGRTARVVGSLAAIDSDASIGNVGTVDMYKQDIVSGAAAAMDGKLAELRAADRAAVDKWESGDSDPAIERELRSAISAHVDGYRDRLTPAQLDPIRKMCLEAVD